ncbi:hypothetical protein Tco_1280923, partial [Tanacetum coccineum]
MMRYERLDHDGSEDLNWKSHDVGIRNLRGRSERLGCCNAFVITFKLRSG